MNRPRRPRTRTIRLRFRGWSLTFLACLWLTPTIGAEPRRPNFVFVYTDDQRWDSLGVVQREQGDRARFPWLESPNLDRLAAEGVRFRNAFVVNSLCAPSRASFLTGRYGHRNGVVNNHTPFPVESVTHATLLRQAGYRTGYVGKWHMGSQRGQRPGFDYSASFVGQGRYLDCPFEVNGVATETKGFVDDVSTDFALGFLRENRDRPFLLAVGFKSAHGPFAPPDRLKDAYAGEQARSVPNLSIPPAYLRGTQAQASTPKPPGAPSTNLNYFRCLLAADENLGRILDALDELRLAEDTMVVFASDHGFYLGEHRLGDKRSAYDESLRIPLLVRYPRLGLKGRTLDPLVLNVDLAPTFLDYAGVAVPDAMQGRSWRPLFEGRASDWRKAFFYCYFYESGYRIPTVTAVRTGTAKLIMYPGHDEWTEVFNLAADPYETKNLFDDPGHAALRRALEDEYARQEAAIGFRIPGFADDPTKDEPKPPLNAWVLDYRFDGDDGDTVRDASKHANHGTARGVPLVEGRDGRKARRFDGRGVIEVPKSASLDPAVKGWTVEATFKAERDHGVLLACGGEANGYALHLEAGKPVFTVRVQNVATGVAGLQSVVGDWVRLTARINGDQKVELLVDGKTVAGATLRLPLRTPNEPLQVGADLGSQVLDDRDASRFVGLIESVRIYSGVAP
jgi:arylsulfatase A-like enzyme